VADELVRRDRGRASSSPHAEGAQSQLVPRAGYALSCCRSCRSTALGLVRMLKGLLALPWASCVRRARPASSPGRVLGVAATPAARHAARGAPRRARRDPGAEREAGLSRTRAEAVRPEAACAYEEAQAAFGARAFSPATPCAAASRRLPRGAREPLTSPCLRGRPGPPRSSTGARAALPSLPGPGGSASSTRTALSCCTREPPTRRRVQKADVVAFLDDMERRFPGRPSSFSESGATPPRAYRGGHRRPSSCRSPSPR